MRKLRYSLLGELNHVTTIGRDGRGDLEARELADGLTSETVDGVGSDLI